MESRVTRFYELHNNKWFHIMNFSLEIIKTDDSHQKYMLTTYGSCFFHGSKTPRASRPRQLQFQERP